jgi:hypothetical protein
MTTTEKVVRYEVAQEVIGYMIAIRAAWIAQEAHQAAPDAAKVGQWQQEQSELARERDELLPADEDAIERVLGQYGPLVKSEYGRLQC